MRPKKVYAHTTAAVLRAKDCVMKAATTVREGAEDIYADAKDINEARLAAQEAAVVEDASEEDAPAVVQTETPEAPADGNTAAAISKTE